RAGRLPAAGLALVARDGDRVVGSVRLWNVSAGGVPALLLGPLAADPALQGRGIGGGLMMVALNRAELAGHRAVVLVGDPEYYARFGFSRSATGALLMPGPVDRRRLLAVELANGGLAGAAGMIVARGAFAPEPAAVRAA